MSLFGTGGNPERNAVLNREHREKRKGIDPTPSETELSKALIKAYRKAKSTEKIQRVATADRVIEVWWDYAIRSGGVKKNIMRVKYLDNENTEINDEMSMEVLEQGATLGDKKMSLFEARVSWCLSRKIIELGLGVSPTLPLTTAAN